MSFLYLYWKLNLIRIRVDVNSFTTGLIRNFEKTLGAVERPKSRVLKMVLSDTDLMFVKMFNCFDGLDPFCEFLWAGGIL